MTTYFYLVPIIFNVVHEHFHIYMYIYIYVYIYIQANSAISNIGYNGCPYRISNVFPFPFGLFCLNERSDVKNPRHIEPISVSLECSK